MTNTATRAAVIDRGEGFISGRNTYSGSFPSFPTIADLIQVQRALGYDPCGYGEPFNITVRPTTTGYLAQWQSYATCD